MPKTRSSSRPDHPWVRVQYGLADETIRHKHRDLVRARYLRKKPPTFKFEFRCLRADFRTYELGDPRDAPNLVPRLIGYCRVEQRPVWGALWTLRNISNTRWAAWFRELEAAGAEPLELSSREIVAEMPWVVKEWAKVDSAWPLCCNDGRPRLSVAGIP